MGNFYKIILSFAIGILLPLEFFGQTDQNNEKGKGEKSSELNYQVLTYQPSPPAPGSYKIIKNVTNEPLKDEVFLYINNHRLRKPYVWVVDKNIEILILPVH